MAILFIGGVCVAGYACLMALLILKLEGDFQATAGAVAQVAVYIVAGTLWTLRRRYAAVTGAVRPVPARRGAQAVARAH